jgi:AcrR family transcriptional regulator
VKKKRSYRMAARADSVEETRTAILRATYDLWLAHDYDDVTLAHVAERAGVTKQTVIRQFGSKDRLAVATVDWQRPVEEAGRAVRPGDVAGAVTVLVARYEKMGDANVRVLALEHRVPAIRYLLEESRKSHRGWVEHVFGPFLPKREGAARELQVMAFYAATEVMLWKLLRRDFRLGREETEAVLFALVSGLTEARRRKGKHR